MNKAELKEKWNQYTDTDKLVDDIMALLTEYHHNNSEHGVCVMLDTYFTNKEPLIKLFMNSDNYAGNMRIVMKKMFERDKDTVQITRFISNFYNNIKANNIILSKVDEHGKRIEDYFNVSLKHLNVYVLEDEEFIKTLSKRSENLKQFNMEGYTLTSVDKDNTFRSIIGLFRRHTSSTVSEELMNEVLSYDSTIKGGTGMKTSRLFNRICECYGVTKAPNYNKLFAQYSDMVSDSVRELQFVISLNPYDYLTMSFGKSWASCHTIDKRNERNMENAYSGMYCGGTLSYMLDGTSIITYVVGPNDNIQTSGKIYRNMFHFDVNENILVQGRVYPQGNDGATDLYKKFRDFMQTELADLIGLENNMWKVKKGCAICRDMTITYGVHYPDYKQFGDCNVSYPSEIPEASNHVIIIGHDGICANCGEKITAADRISHKYC